MATPRPFHAHLVPNGQSENFGRISATRRVARTLFVGSAPTADAANRGMEDRRIKLGCTLPGESPAIFGDARSRGLSGSLVVRRGTAAAFGARE